MKPILHYKAGPYLPITETWIYGQIKNLKRYKPIVYCHKTENLDIYPTENIRSLELKEALRDPWSFFNRAWNKVFNFYPLFAFFLIRDKPNLVHAHFGPSGYSFLKLKRIFGLPLVTTFYGYDLSSLPKQNPEWTERYRRLFDEGELFLVEGSNMKSLLTILGCSKEKIVVQHLGVDLEKIKFASREIGNNEKVRVLIAGTFTEKKGISYAVEAFGRVRRANPNLKLELTIIGDSTGLPEGEREKQKIVDAMNKNNLNECTRILGYQTHNFFLGEAEHHHIFLSPSVHASNGDLEGGAPISIIEMSASGMPILSTTHCDIPEVVVDSKSGYLVPERDVDALAEKLEMLVLNPSTWKRMGEYGRKHIETEYDLWKQVSSLETIYDTLTKTQVRGN